MSITERIRWNWIFVITVFMGLFVTIARLGREAKIREDWNPTLGEFTAVFLAMWGALTLVLYLAGIVISAIAFWLEDRLSKRSK